MSIHPSLEIELPYRKRGPSFRSDFVVFKQLAEQPFKQPSGSNEQPSGSGKQPSGSGEQPSGSGEQPSGSGKQPSGSGKQPSGSGAGGTHGVGMVVYHSSKPIVVIKAKVSITVDFRIIPPYFVMEMLIYCIYIMRMKKTDVVLGCITDGKTWHTLKLTMDENKELTVHKYVNFSSHDNQFIIRKIPFY